jgi:hypothetical protein
MGLLAALDLHKRLQSGIEGKCVEVEYLLYSWGEIYPPFLGNREHSIAARYILRDFPFKLFSSSTPYDDPLPQKLCLTFKSPFEVKKDTKVIHMSGIFPEETVKEFTAFLSLVTRRRVFVSRQVRYDGLPIEKEVDLYQQSHFQEKQRLKEIEPKEIYQLLENLQVMDRRIADGFILAMRLYHTSVKMMYAEPEFSYLFLITCLEAISSVAHKDYRPPNEEKFLDERFPEWRTLVNTSEQGTKLKELLLRNERFSFQKLFEFVNENMPQRFWSEMEDDAKPDYLISIIESPGQERISHSEITKRDWEMIEKGRLKQVLRDIYNARSDLVHEGKRLPKSIVLGHFPGVPVEALGEIKETLHEGQTKRPLPIPPLLTFERLVSYSMVEFLRKQHGGGIS